MKKGFCSFIAIGWILCIFLASSGPAQTKTDYPIRPVDFTHVKVQDTFWFPKMEINRTATIPFIMEQNEKAGAVDNFRKAAGMKEGSYVGRRFADTDVYKFLEGASYSLLLHPDPQLKSQLDELIRLIGLVQEPDGYLYPARTLDPENPAAGAGPERWYYLRGSHELYNSGHMFEAAVAHFLATGERTFLDIAVKNADLLVKTFGPDRKHDFPGHEEVEIGLAKLYRATGNQKYLDLAKFFLDQRGRPHDGHLYPSDSSFALYNGKEYMQDHEPVLEQTKAVGHAVRAMYLYAGMADVAALGGYPEYIKAIDRLWEDVAGKKLYLTGGVGARGTSEAFGEDYELPNASAYTETCAAIGNALWNYRLFLLHGDAKYIDVLERIMYNGLISGVALDGRSFFYQNPLQASGRTGRSPWFTVACCPPNLMRFLASVPGYVYAVKDDALYVNLFMAGTADVEVQGHQVQIRQQTRYPWDGAVRILVDPAAEEEFSLHVRIPGWSRNEPVPTDLYRFLNRNSDNPVVQVNRVPVALNLEKGYVAIRRAWKKGDVIDLSLPMPVRRVIAHEGIKDDVGKTALQRGPLVFCLEGPDNGGAVLNLALADDAALEAEFRPELLNGVVVIKGSFVTVKRDDAGNEVGRGTQDGIAIPYYAWANRGRSEMTVWIPRDRR
jgi:DUF1680 family protein